jgi:transposase
MHKTSYKDRIKDLERRRLKAGDMFEKGKSQAEIATRFGVSRAAACQWHTAWESDKENGLRSKGMSGITPKLTPRQKRVLKKEILKGPIKAGYSTDFWTLERIRALAKKKLKVSLGQTSGWRTVIELGFSVQKPDRRARERNESAIAEWKLKTFPKIKKMGR